MHFLAQGFTKFSSVFTPQAGIEIPSAGGALPPPLTMCAFIVILHCSFM